LVITPNLRTVTLAWSDPLRHSIGYTAAATGGGGLPTTFDTRTLLVLVVVRCIQQFLYTYS